MWFSLLFPKLCEVARLEVVCLVYCFLTPYAITYNYGLSVVHSSTIGMSWGILICLVVVTEGSFTFLYVCVCACVNEYAIF